MLEANPALNYIFSSWSGDCTGMKLSTSLVMNSSKNCTANFAACASLSVKNYNSSLPYDSIQAAYDDVEHTFDGDVLEILARHVTGNVTFDGGLEITIKGGYDCSFLNNLSNSAIVGSISIVTGTIIMDNILIR